MGAAQGAPQLAPRGTCWESGLAAGAGRWVRVGAGGGRVTSSPGHWARTPGPDSRLGTSEGVGAMCSGPGENSLIRQIATAGFDVARVEWRGKYKAATQHGGQKRASGATGCGGGGTASLRLRRPRSGEPGELGEPGEPGERGAEAAAVFQATGLSHTLRIATQYDKTELGGDASEQTLKRGFPSRPKC